MEPDGLRHGQLAGRNRGQQLAIEMLSQLMIVGGGPGWLAGVPETGDHPLQLRQRVAFLAFGLELQVPQAWPTRQRTWPTGHGNPSLTPGVRSIGQERPAVGHTTATGELAALPADLRGARNRQVVMILPPRAVPKREPASTAVTTPTIPATVRNPCQRPPRSPCMLSRCAGGTLCLRLHAHGGQDYYPPRPGASARRRQQRRLPGAGLTTHHQRAAALADAVDQVVEHPSSRSRPTKGSTVISQP